MSTPRILLSAFGACAVFLWMAHSNSGTSATLSAAQGAAKVANPITGEGLPNPAPKVTRNWGQLPAGRKWGTSAGVDIDTKDGHVWAYERCGAGTLGGAGGGGVTCETNDVDPIFKFDRNTGAVLANFGKGLMITPHGIHVDPQGNVWIADFAGNKEGTKGHQVHKFSPKGEKLLSLGIAGKPGNADGQFNQPNDVVTGPDGSIYVIERCFQNSCAGRTEPSILKYDANGTLLKAFGAGLFVFPHGSTLDGEGNLWVTDAGGADGKGHQVLKFDASGNVVMRLGRAGISGSTPGLFDQPTDVVVAANGDIFVTDSHRNGKNNRVVKFRNGMASSAARR